MDTVDKILAGTTSEKIRPKSKAIEIAVEADLAEILIGLDQKASGELKRSRVKSRVVNDALRFYFEHKGLLSMKD